MGLYKKIISSDTKKVKNCIWVTKKYVQTQFCQKFSYYQQNMIIFWVPAPLFFTQTHLCELLTLVAFIVAYNCKIMNLLFQRSIIEFYLHFGYICPIQMLFPRNPLKQFIALTALLQSRGYWRMNMLQMLWSGFAFEEYSFALYSLEEECSRPEFT